VAGAGADSAFTALASPHRQPFLTAEPLGLLAVDQYLVTAQQDMQPAVSEPS